MIIMDYFLGATSPAGFANFFEQLADNSYPLRTYIIKAGPGCGKSSLMRRIADRIKAAGYDFEQIHCSSDPLSLDGVICKDLGFAIVDGTAPHAIEPSIPAAKQEVVSLFHCIDNKQMSASLDKLLPLFELNAQYICRAKRFVTAAGSLHHDIERTSQTALLYDKIDRYAKNLAAKALPKMNGYGTESLRLACAFTPLGIVDYTASNFTRCKNVLIFEDRFGAAAHTALNIIKGYALAAGYDITTCRSPMSAYDKIDAVYVPDVDTAFIHSSYISDISIPGCRLVHDKRFYDAEIINACSKRLSFCKKAALELVDEACALLGDAKLVHDEIESYYKAAIDFAKIREREKEISVDLGLES